MYNIYSKYLSDMKELMVLSSRISCTTIADYGTAKISKNFRKKSKRYGK